MPSSPLDVVVIGAGHNGLTCACYLAAAGLTRRAISAEAWVRVDKPHKWGGIVGADRRGDGSTGCHPPPPITAVGWSSGS